MPLRVITRQRPVGQGGFLTSEIAIIKDNRVEDKFSFVFDCGSTSNDHLRIPLGELEYQSIDMLFISHLDVDHVNGVDLLLSKAKVNTVVLPCLDPLTTTLLVSGALADASLTGNLSSLLLEPVKWFASRGVSRVLFLERSLDDDGSTVPALSPDALPPSEEIDLRPRESKDESKSKLSVRLLTDNVSTLPGPIATSLLASMTEMHIQMADSSGTVEWLVVPYVHPFASSELQAFHAAVRKVLNVPAGTGPATSTFNRKIKDILRDEEKCKRLKACYAHVSDQHNRVSLSLYSGPVPSSITRWHQRAARYDAWQHNHHIHRGNYLLHHPWALSDTGKLAWLCTGDADLRTQVTQQAWLKRYDRLLGHVGFFQLPHHGSYRSLHEDVLDRMPESILLACAGKDRVHHPHPTLLARIQSSERALWQVSEDSSSEYSTYLQSI